MSSMLPSFEKEVVMGGHLLMSSKERRRKVEFEGIVEGRMRIREASQKLGLSYRQCRRSFKRYREEGDRGLVHRSRGRRSNRARPDEFRRAVVQLYRERYEGFGPTLAAEKLAEQGYELDHETARRWLIADGQWKRGRKRGKHRARRVRKGHFGELVQMDGSHHGWFGEGRPRACLMNMVDDAQGTTMALMADEESTEAAMRLLWSWIERYGIPKALYTDKKNVFVTDREPTIEEQLASEEPMTAFGKACKKLGIEIITAHSPQAKGRVERSHGVYQDRLVKELRLHGITTLEGANELLADGFSERLNARFQREPARPRDFHRRVPKGLNLAQVFCWEETRSVQNDWTIRYNNRFYQILKENRPRPRPKEKVLVRLLLDRNVQILYRDKKLTYEPIAQPPPRTQEKAALVQQPTPHAQCRPAPDHPWRNFHYGRRRAACAARSRE
jgi:molybdenum-dependent DNA-binding transcriptional regulator ModE